MRIYYLICYDVSDDFRLNRIFKYLKGQGVHLQYSVFFCYLSYKELSKIFEDLKSLINEGQDDIRIYPVLSSFKPIILGQEDRVPEGIDIFME